MGEKGGEDLFLGYLQVWSFVEARESSLHQRAGLLVSSLWLVVASWSVVLERILRFLRAQ